ncbi:MAG: hypothetical protein AVDCRST_MAG42-351, partial [uncultured Chthoniobacterales bacterium]
CARNAGDRACRSAGSRARTRSPLWTSRRSDARRCRSGSPCMSRSARYHRR